MKFCPNCGASLPGSAVSFCPSCGFALKEAGEKRAGQPGHDTKRKGKLFSKKESKAELSRRTVTETKEPDPPDSASPPADGYDGYYEDILPIDEGRRKVEKLDPDMIKRIAFIAGGALLIIIAAIVALLLM